MASAEQIQAGVLNYIENDFMPKLIKSANKKNQGLLKIGIGSAAILAARQIQGVFDSVKDNKALTALGIIDKDGEFDIDILHDVLTQSIEKYGEAKQSIPFLGDYTFDNDDISALFGHINKAVE